MLQKRLGNNRKDERREAVQYGLKDRGIRVITGSNLDDDGSQSNGAGKTTKPFLHHFGLGCGGVRVYRSGFRVYKRGLYSNIFSQGMQL